jgi:hypothetical protein
VTTHPSTMPSMAPQSDTKKPSQPHCPRTTSLLAHDHAHDGTSGSPSSEIALYEHLWEVASTIMPRSCSSAMNDRNVMQVNTCSART